MPSAKPLKPLFTVDNLSRFALALVFIWFGALKVFNLSPAEPLITDLAGVLIPFIPINLFLVFLGLWEVAIGVLFLIKPLIKWAILLFGVQMFTTFMPFIFLPSEVWHAFLVPTLVGQYILKNVVLIMLAVQVWKPTRSKA